ncbi:MAG: hypothetical protein O7J95_11085, partial [Planctomycetota bacterium]|nr:hypothetical protein [Planctomycetota bacterium]
YAGVFCRLDLEARAVEVWCEGMRNAYDFDFTPTGDIFGWDSDSERDEGLIWYRPCRLYHFTPGADCGWRSRGTGKIPAYALDSISPTAEVHRGSPTGVVCYRHTAFPARYRGGLFALDWTMGRVYFFAPRPAGASYTASTELFVEASGSVSFAPTDVELTPAGDLLISSGGRGIPGEVYRIRRIREEPSSRRRPVPAPAPRDGVEGVLLAPSPLSAWSRAAWRPRARALGAAPFLEVLRRSARGLAPPRRDTDEPAARRGIRALEVVVELFPSRAAEAVRLAARSRYGALRAQAARWAGEFGEAADLLPLTNDSDPRVRRSVVESSTRFWTSRGSDELLRRVFSLSAAGDRRLRQAIFQSLTHVPAARLPAAERPGERLVRGFAILRAGRRGELPAEAVHLALDVLEDRDVKPDDLLDGLRLLDAAFDRLKGREDPESGTFDRQWADVDLSPWRPLVERALRRVRPLLDSSRRELFHEALRLSGKLRDDDPESAARAAARLTAKSLAREDVFVLWGLARLEAAFSEETLRRVAEAGLALPGKVRREGVGRDSRWSLYQRGIWSRLNERQPGLARRIWRDGRFGEPDHLDILEGSGEASLAGAVRHLLARPLPAELTGRRRILAFLVDRSPDDLLGALEPRLLASLEEPALEAAALRGLARRPREPHRGAFTRALAGRRIELLGPALRGLEGLPDPPDPADEIPALLRWGRALDRDPSQRFLRDQVAARLALLSGTRCGYREKHRQPQEAALDCWVAALRDEYPDLGETIDQALDEAAGDEDLLERLLREAPLDEGDASRGRDVFQRLSCGSCHHLGGKGQRVGPDLGGVGKRLGVRELLTEIVLPSRVVAKRYYFTEYELRGGERVNAMPVYSARNALVLITREGRYRRLDPSTIVDASPRSRSLMPDGLLAGLAGREVADLLAYLRSVR